MVVSRRSLGILAAAALLASTPGTTWAAGEGAPGPTAAPAGGASAAPASRANRPTGRTLDDTIQFLTQKLQLDVPQQAAVRKVLLNEREQVQKIWNNEAIPAAQRVAATRSLGAQTAGQIKALLSAQQKKLYNPPGSPADRPAPEAGTRSAEDWMKLMAPH